MRSAGFPNLRFRCRGLALVMVLWIVAALSLFVVGMSQAVRQQVKTTASLTEQVRARALAEGAIALALQRLTVTRDESQLLRSVPVDYAGVQMHVQVMPLNGLIALNAAQPVLISALLQVAAGVPEPQANRLAHQVLAWRAGDASRAIRARQFESVEDLLLVPGMDYAIYSRVRDLVTPDALHAAQVNPLAAPLPVLLVLARGNRSVAERIASRRQAGQEGDMDLSGLDGALIATGSSLFYRVAANVPLDAGKMLVFSRDVRFSGFERQIAPWRTLRTQWRIESASH